jgi:hypothetical protein
VRHKVCVEHAQQRENTVRQPWLCFAVFTLTSEQEASAPGMEGLLVA